MTATKTITPETLLTRYAADIAFVAEEQPATTLADLAEQVSTAAERLEAARIQGADDLDTAVAALHAAADTQKATERTVFLKRAGRYLKYATDMVDDYRLMV